MARASPADYPFWAVWVISASGLVRLAFLDPTFSTLLQTTAILSREGALLLLGAVKSFVQLML